MTTSICNTVPAINNGKVLTSGTNEAEYECLSGFQLVGRKIINCDATSGWDVTPSCDVISNNDNIFTWGPEWLLILLAIILILSVLSCTGCIIWACCCRRRGEGFLCFGGENGRGGGRREGGEWNEDSELLYNESAGVYTMSDGTMFIPVRPLHKGEYGRGGYHKRNETEYEENGGFFGCCGGKKRRRRPSADMVFDESEGIYTLKDGSMYTPVKPQKTTDANGRVVWKNQADIDSNTWFSHHGGFHGEISGNKARKYNSNDVANYTPNDFKSDKQNGHWFLEDGNNTRNNRTLVTTKIHQNGSEPVSQTTNPTTVYILEDDPRVKADRQRKKQNPKPKQKPQPIVVKSVDSPRFLVDQPREKTEVIVLRAQDLQPNRSDDKEDKDNDDRKNDSNEKKNKDGADDGKKGGKSKPDTKVVVINVNHKYDKGRSKSTNENPKEEEPKPTPRADNFVNRSLPARTYTPSETGTRDTFDIADVEDLIANEINDSGVDRSTDEDEPRRPNADNRFVDTVTRQLILDKMREKKKFDKVWIPHSHPIRNKKHFTK
ncbi:hypothetical protein LOTGIDRAFT_168856 [Lottia gigantea]|uniref:Sushi domain-containing protein n=1 Tax=Lottia gigantea TaxID=225164 RepID=V3ZJJ5_LOTGI|nr:hypothetical protein LOTGIDRAFT_168856 [Lottia gigantea]ESO84402.1 hypothetical protein LOTGIDRAFT_168856 [Lottia gigantea]